MAATAAALTRPTADRKQATVRYLVISTADIEPQECIDGTTVTGLPGIGDRFEAGSALVVSDYGTVEALDDTKRLYVVPVIYAYRSVAGGTDAARLLSYRLASVAYEVPAIKGYLWDPDAETWAEDQSPVQTSAGDAFDPGPMRTAFNAVLAFSQTEGALFDQNDALALTGTLNASAMTVCGVEIAATAGLLRKVEPRLTPEGAWQCDYEIEVAHGSPHDPEYLDQGYRYLNGSGKLTDILMSDINTDYAQPAGSKRTEDRAVSDPIKLDGAGGILGTGSGVVPVWRRYRFATVADWGSVLDLVEDI